MNREVVRKLVQVYIVRNKLSNPEFAKQAKINDRTVRRLLNSEDSISDQTLELHSNTIGCIRSDGLSLIDNQPKRVAYPNL